MTSLRQDLTLRGIELGAVSLAHEFLNQSTTLPPRWGSNLAIPPAFACRAMAFNPFGVRNIVRPDGALCHSPWCKPRESGANPVRVVQTPVRCKPP